MTHRRGLLVLVIAAIGVLVLAAPAAAQAPLEERVLQTEIGLNLLLVALGGVLVLFMLAGFTLVEAGYTRAKNSAQVSLQKFTILGLGIVGYFVCGYALQFGAATVGTIGLTEPAGTLFPSAQFGLFGTGGFFLSGASSPAALGFFLFQSAFMAITATIPSGAMQERWRFGSFIWWGLFCGALYFPLYGNWVWGGGWLSALGREFGLGNGVVDFAGSGVVHAIGGIAGLVGAWVLGPRRGKYDADGRPRTIGAHNIPLAILGTFILLFGWFGFNGASTFAATDTRFAVVMTNTLLAGAFGSVSALVFAYQRLGKPDPGGIANGMLGGLVAITAPCAFVPPWSAALIGAIAGWLVLWATDLVERRWRVDDPVGAVAVHLFCGLFGLVALGVFADGSYGAGLNGVAGPVTGALYGGWGQLIAQLVSVLVVVLYGGGLSLLYFRLQDAITPMRSRPEDERIGLDVEELGVLGYADFVLLDDEELEEEAAAYQPQQWGDMTPPGWRDGGTGSWERREER